MKVRIGHGVGILAALVLLALIWILVLPVVGFLFTALANTVVGLIIIFLVDEFFELGIVYDLFVFLIVAVFGLVGVVAVILLDLLGIRL